MVTVSIIIPTFNRTLSLNTCVRSILESELTDVEIIIVNDYKDGSAILHEHNISPFVKVVDNPGKGVASARNFGAKLSTSPLLIFVDDDMILNNFAITKAISFLNTNLHTTYNANWIYDEALLHKISITQFGRYLIRYNFTSLKGWNANNSIEWKDNSLLQVNGITSQFLAIRKTDFEKLEGYNEKFPFAGFEDYELNTRLKANGIVNVIDTSVLIYHHEIDRVDPFSWLSRQCRGAKTRKVAVSMGFSELEINYSATKKNAYRILLFFKKPLFVFLKLIPDTVFFDILYFKIINVLLGIHIYEGYHSDH